jgi:hypothetical protein
VINAMCNVEICFEWIGMVFLPNLNNLRSLEQFANEDAVLLSDNCAKGGEDQVSDLSRGASVKVVMWAPDTMQRFQKLEVSLLEVPK